MDVPSEVSKVHIQTENETGSLKMKLSWSKMLAAKGGYKYNRKEELKTTMKYKQSRQTLLKMLKAFEIRW